MKSQVKHYRKLADGTLKLVGIETVEVEAPSRSDFYRAFLARRNAHDLAEQARWEDHFESLADAACEGEG